MNSYRRVFFIFVALVFFFYFFINQFHSLVPFNKDYYSNSAYHYLGDERVEGGKFNLLRSLGQYDAQWFLKIANEGYKNSPEKLIDQLPYAYFPLYPISIFFINILFGNIEISAFVLSVILLIVNFFSLYFVISKIESKIIALKTIFLLFLFPLGIFYYSYFSEGLFLLLLIWYSYFIIQKKWLYASLFLGLLIITRGVALGLLVPHFIYLFNIKPITFKSFCYGLLSIMPFTVWLAYCYFQTGNPIFTYSIRSEWNTIIFPLLHNMWVALHFPMLPLHGFHFSQLDILLVFIVLGLLILSRSKLKSPLWIISFALWLTPLLATDTMSYSRYQTVSFPLFLYLAKQIRGLRYLIFVATLYILLLITGVLFVNWYWVG